MGDSQRAVERAAAASRRFADTDRWIERRTGRHGEGGGGGARFSFGRARGACGAGPRFERSLVYGRRRAEIVCGERARRRARLSRGGSAGGLRGSGTAARSGDRTIFAR